MLRYIISDYEYIIWSKLYPKLTFEENKNFPSKLRDVVYQCLRVLIYFQYQIDVLILSPPLKGTNMLLAILADLFWGFPG